jgi:scpA/B protein
MEISYKLERFEGPLDLLLYLIERDRIDIYDIPIVSITEQYLNYMNELETDDLDLMSEFIVMATTLLDIKAKMLLPLEEDEETKEIIDPRAELVARLLEYKKYKMMANELAGRYFEAGKILFKEPSIPAEVEEYKEPVNLDELFGGLNLHKLKEVFDRVMKQKENRIDKVRSNFGTIKKEPVSLETKITEVMAYARKYRKFTFRSLLESQATRLEVVVTFLSVLELMKIGKIALLQEETFGEMQIETLEEEGKEETLDLSDILDG